MTRLLGVIGEAAVARVEKGLPGLAFGWTVAPRHSGAIELRPGAAIGLISHRDMAPSYQVGPVTVVIDGVVLGRHSGTGNSAQVVADLYLAKGFEAALGELAGDFAIALHDARDGAVWLARDRVGAKPLYYARTAGHFSFSSRPRALTAMPGVGSEVNRRFAAVFAGSHYRYIDNRPEESPYRNIRQLPAAHWIRFCDDRIQIGKYWGLNDLPDWTDSESDLAERYRDLLIEVVGDRVRSSERPAFTLSGGMDSSSVVSCATIETGQPATAFSTVYTDKTFDESDDIRPMLETKVSTWNQVRVDDPDVFSLVRRMVDVNDEPVATATWLSHFILCENVASAGYGSLFGGLGGDELNAGEYEYFFSHFADLKRAGRYSEFDTEVEQWALNHDHPIWRKNAEVANATISRCTDPSVPGRSLPDQSRMRRYYGAIDRSFFDLDGFEPVMEVPFASYLKTRTWQDISRETAPCCLRAEDRQTSAFGLDNVVPFFDHRLLEFMFRVPGSMKIRNGVTKVLLRAAMKGILPEETRVRVKKTGWNAPAHLWFAGKGREPLLDMVRSREFRERGIYRPDEVERLANEHAEIVASGEPRENHMMFLWQMVNLETWLRSLA